MNTWFYLMLIYSMSITCNSFNPHVKYENFENTSIKDLTVKELTSGNYSAQETELRDNKTNTPKPFFEKTRSILPRLPGIAKEIANAVVSDISTDVTPDLPKNLPMTWGLLNFVITNVKKQLQNLKVSCSFKRGENYYTIYVRFDSILFGTQHFEFNALRERIRRRDVPIIEEDESNNNSDNNSNDESDNKSDDESDNEELTTIPVSLLEKNVITITTEEEFIKRASDTHIFPYHVIITASINEQEKWCQGVLIKSNWILTSKTCIKNHFDLNSKRHTKIFLDAINNADSNFIFYSNVILKYYVTVGPTLVEPGPDGLEDMVLLKIVTVPKSTEVTAVDLKLSENDIVEGNCFIVTRCSDGVVRGLLYKLEDREFEIDFGFLKPGTTIVCDDQLLSIKTNETSFYPIFNAKKWIENGIQGKENQKSIRSIK
ncbi:Hypothetical protein CINCED_3A020392 [Cinara cedri]|uniref:Peptidase S1 domain-containing protein n=1 Tax=Cinara cedri TaxID=506608 RepID=A0A5E4MDP2_9HEMI|nr:Hypothetical protein CINCED_3A020392 [Cinara cedri]